MSDFIRARWQLVVCITLPTVFQHDTHLQCSHHVIYRIMLIVCGGKLSRFSRIYFQLRKFSSENFLSYYKVFLGLEMADSGPGSGPGLLRYFKPCRKDSCQIPLPNPTGPLCEKLDSATIEEANEEVTAVIADPTLWKIPRILPSLWNCAVNNSTAPYKNRAHGWNISGKMPHYLISRFTNCDSVSIAWITWFIFTFKSLTKDGRVSNYPDRRGNIKCSYPFQILPLLCLHQLPTW